MVKKNGSGNPLYASGDSGCGVFTANDREVADGCDFIDQLVSVFYPNTGSLDGFMVPQGKFGTLNATD
jgi:hypothetical protein